MNTEQLREAFRTGGGWQRDAVSRVFATKEGVRETLAPLLALSNPPAVRAHAVALISRRAGLQRSELLAALSDPHPGVRIAALRSALETNSPVELADFAALADDSDPHVRFAAAIALGRFPSSEAEPVLARMVANPEADAWLRTAVLSSLKPDSALFARLNRNDSPPAATAPVLPKPTTEDRAKVIASYASVSKLQGDPEKGRVHFQTHCAICHRLHDIGIQVGPDLAMTAGKPDDWMLAAIFDPSQAVEARYRAQHVVLKSGAELAGLITAETANNIVIRLAGGADQPVLRDDIKSADTLPSSLMPAAFESLLKPQDVADLLSWVRKK